VQQQEEFVAYSLSLKITSTLLQVNLSKQDPAVAAALTYTLQGYLDMIQDSVSNPAKTIIRNIWEQRS